MRRTTIFAKCIAMLLLFLQLSISLCGCGMLSFTVEPKEDALVSDSSNLIMVGYSQLGSESVWRSANSLSIQNALTKENGYFLLFNNARQKQENQIKAIRSFISQRVDYIVFSPVTEDGWDTVLKEAKEAHIPVLLADRMVDSDASLYTAWVGTNSLQEGEKAARWLEEDLEKNNRTKEDINIVVLLGTIGASVQLGRMMGFDAISDTHPNWHILAQESGDFTIAKGKEVMEDFLSKYNDIDVILCQNDDMAIGAMEALDEHGMEYGVGTDLYILSIDATRPALELVKEGKINVDVECNPEQGPAVAELIAKLERGEPIEKINYIEEMVFTQENVEQYLDKRTY